MAEQTLGEQGENIAEAYLKSRGYVILDRNWEVFGRGGRQIGELDIVAKNKHGYAIVEVKSGSGWDAYRPEVHMTEKKIVKLTRTAKAWLNAQGKLDQPWQIDLVAVDFGKDPPSVRHYCHVNDD